MKKASALWLSLSLGLAFLASAHAGPITFSNTSGNLGQGTVGNNITQTVSGETVTATAWSVTGNGGTTFQTAALGQYSGLGLGVCNVDELAATGGCQSPQHEVDDSGQFDFVLFHFSSPVTAVSIVIDPVCDCNTDASYIAGNNLSPSGDTLAQLGTFTTNNETTPDVTRTITISGLNDVNSLLFGASILGNDNYFKIQSITVTEGASAASVPEPATFGLAGVALIGLALVGRKRRKHRAR